MAKAIQIGGVLVAVTPFGDEDRKRCRDLVRVMGTPFRGDPVTRAEDAAARRARIRAHRRRVRRNDPGQEPVTCWGCGLVSQSGTRVGKLGWHTRSVRLATGRAVEVHCPECFARWGWVEPLTIED